MIVVIIKPQVDPFVFPVRHGVNVFATGRLLNFGLCPLAISRGIGWKPRPTRTKSTYWRHSSMRKWQNYTFKSSVRSFGLHVDFAGCPQCVVHPAQKIRAESSSNGSELRSAGLAPHKIRAELSSNGSSRSHPALAESLRTRASFKLRSSDAHAL